MKLKEIWKQTNLQDGELSQYYEDTSMTEYELYSLHRERGSIIRNRNCTIMKGIFSNETFVNRMKDSKSESYELLKVKFQDMFSEIGREDDIPYFQTFVMNLDQTDDCKVAFTIQVPWTNPAQQGGFHKEVQMGMMNFENISFDHLVVQDFCPILKRYTAYKLTVGLRRGRDTGEVEIPKKRCKMENGVY